jgi:hypothetical protein
MSSVSKASVLLRSVATPRRNIKATITAIATHLGWSHSRTRDVWYADARRIDSDEMDALRAEAHEQAAHYEAVARAMEQVGAHRYRTDIAALVHAARALRDMAGPRDDSTK